MRKRTGIPGKLQTAYIAIMIFLLIMTMQPVTGAVSAGMTENFSIDKDKNQTGASVNEDGDSQAAGEDCISITCIRRDNMTTEQILKMLAEDDSVILRSRRDISCSERDL